MTSLSTRIGFTATLVLGAVMMVLGTACRGNLDMASPDQGTDAEDGPQGAAVSFSADVLPILTSVCATCHRDGGIADQAGIALRLVEDLAFDMLLNNNSVQDQSLSFVQPGDSASSLLFLKISSDSPPVGSRMPFQLVPLSDARIATIRDWIDQGALDN
ncbi:MAG: hypothetical protein V3W34_12740 [Phycisphaerae bacterium]